jgi:hypothetical protein
MSKSQDQSNLTPAGAQVPPGYRVVDSPSKYLKFTPGVPIAGVIAAPQMDGDRVALQAERGR